MLDPGVHVWMRVRFVAVPREIVVVLMMFVVCVHMVMREALMDVPMQVPLGREAVREHDSFGAASRQEEATTRRVPSWN